MKDAIEIIKSLKDLLIESVSGRPVNVAEYNGEMSKASAFIAEHEKEIGALSIRLLKGDGGETFHISSKFYGDTRKMIYAAACASKEGDKMSVLLRAIAMEILFSEF